MNHEELDLRIDRFIQENRQSLFDDLASLIAVDSVRAEPAGDNAPFGPGVRKAMDVALAMARRMGLETLDCDGYMVCADVPGSSGAHIAAIAHLDVVPAGNGWDTDPFTMTRREGFVLGRGVQDNKGPGVVALYAAKFFRELCAGTGQTLPHTLRILLGGAEETTMEDVDYYLERHPMPAFCFTPDASFPVCHGEKGGFVGLFTSEALNGRLLDFQGGLADNVVPDLAWALVREAPEDLPPAPGITVEREGAGVVRITGRGVGGHASTPEGTVNAIALVVGYLLGNDLCDPAERRYLTMLKTLLSSTDASSFGMAASDAYFTPLTCIGGVIRMEGGVLRQSIDVRFPTSITLEEMEGRCAALAATGGATFSMSGIRPTFYVSADSPEIAACMDAYRAVTGRADEPFTMGGGTYARHFTNAVSFGMEEPGANYPAFVGPVHGANEGIPEELFLKALKIYILAVAKLMKIGY